MIRLFGDGNLWVGSGVARTSPTTYYIVIWCLQILLLGDS